MERDGKAHSYIYHNKNLPELQFSQIQKTLSDDNEKCLTLTHSTCTKQSHEEELRSRILFIYCSIYLRKITLD